MLFVYAQADNRTGTGWSFVIMIQSLALIAIAGVEMIWCMGKWLPCVMLEA